MVCQLDNRTMILDGRPVVFLPRPMEGAVSWWLSGGIAAANCVAAYQPKGAANFGASLLDLSTAGNNAVDPGGAGTPAWDAVNGWKGAAGDYLTTPLIAANARTWSVIVRFSNAGVGGYACGSINTAGGSMGLTLRPNNAGGVVYIHGSSAAPLQVLPALTNGVLAIAGTTCYRNGVAEVGAPGAGTTVMIANDALGLNLTGAHFGYVVYVQAEAWYNTTLSGPQVAAVTAAMLTL